MNKICVLMSTYNGSKYIKEQLDSILNQEKVNIELLIRDDGSTDKTLEILEEYSKKYKNLKYYSGSNLKTARSFMDLLSRADGYQYYSFADQDDVWDLDKLHIGISYLKDDYHLYGCSKRIVDENLKILDRADENVYSLELGATILRGRVSGCTMVFDRYLRNEIIKYNPKVVTMHDSWILRIASCLGKIYYDKDPHINYRQHTQNVVGARKTLLEITKLRIKNFKNRKNDKSRVEIAKQLYQEYGQHLNEFEKKNLYYFAYSRENIIYRLKLFIGNFLKGESFLDIFCIKLLILIGLS